MTLREALAIVLELADYGSMTDAHIAIDPDLQDIQDHQNEAIDIVFDFFDNHLDRMEEKITEFQLPKEWFGGLK